MAEVSGAYRVRTAAPGRAAPEGPGAALRRLNLPGKAAAAWEDVLQLDGSNIRIVARTIDAERQSLERDHQRANEIVTSLKTIGEKLVEAEDLAAANAKSGMTRSQRRQNQNKIDALLEQVDEVADSAGAPAARAFDGDATLAAGPRSMRIDRISLSSLGRLTVNGQTLSLKDVASRGPLDTARRSAGIAHLARRSIKDATEAVTELQAEVETFATDSLRPRLADVAEAMSGIYHGASLGHGEDAMVIARELRAIMLASATAATVVGAEGWDRERVLELLTP